MKTLIEIRANEDWTNREYGSSLGEPLLVGGTPFVRKIVLDVGDPRLADLKARLERDHKRPAVSVSREYTVLELSNAELFQFFITDGLSDSCGEDFGTEYDDSRACPTCGAGRVQCSPLRLDLSLMPVGLDIARTIALNEWIVSQRLVDLMQRHSLTGYYLQQVEHKGKKQPKEHWYQLIVTGKVGQTVIPTHFGLNYFEEDTERLYMCPQHLHSGLHVLSEVFVSRQNVENVDLALTSNRIGRRNGALRPCPMILASPRFYQLFTQNKIQSCRVEIAHIIDCR